MLQSITIALPVANQESNDFFVNLQNIFDDLPGVKQTTNQIILNIPNPADALPIIFFEKSETLALHFKSNKIQDNDINKIINHVISQSEPLEYGLISIKDFYHKIIGHIARIDHIGVNLPSYVLKKEQWDRLISKLSSTTTLYNYPTGENWPFIVPGTIEEFQDDIKDFCIGREPKFELVYDEYSKIPTFQIDIETNLSQKEVEKLFPDPIGISFKGLESYFRSVYIANPFLLLFRFDIRFKSKNKKNTWNTGKWLVKSGKRICSSTSDGGTSLESFSCKCM